jgi:CpeT protein
MALCAQNIIMDRKIITPRTALIVALVAGCSSTTPQPNGTTGDVGSGSNPDATASGSQDPADAGDPITADAGDTTPADAGDTPNAEVADRLFRYLIGKFDSTAQAATNSQYFEIQLYACAVDAPDIGPRVMYVEQATLSRLSQPYRQRVYVVEPGASDDEAISRVYTVANEASWVGACDESTPRTINAGQITERAGCAVYLKWQDNQFDGGTRGASCRSTLSGASHATSEVTMDLAEIRSWDRGYNGQNQQVWGAEAGPYVFVRQP